MSTRTQRAWASAALMPLALGFGVLGAATPAQAASCSGVWVTVETTTRCATSYSSGTEALRSAGFAPQLSGGFVCRIAGSPATCHGGVPYWSYWHAHKNTDGTYGPWVYSQLGADEYSPDQGDAEGWSYGDGSSGPSGRPPQDSSATQSSTAPDAGSTGSSGSGSSGSGSGSSSSGSGSTGATSGSGSSGSGSGAPQSGSGSTGVTSGSGSSGPAKGTTGSGSSTSSTSKAPATTASKAAGPTTSTSAPVTSAAAPVSSPAAPTTSAAAPTSAAPTPDASASATPGSTPTAAPMSTNAASGNGSPIATIVTVAVLALAGGGYALWRHLRGQRA